MKNFLKKGIGVILLLAVLSSPNNALAVYDLTKSLDLESTSSQYALRADGTELSFTGDFTIEGWINIESLATDEGFKLASKWTTGGSQRSYMFGVTDISGARNLRLNVSDTGENAAGGQKDSGTETLTDGTWYHVAVVYDNTGDAEFFINGVSVGTGTGMPTSVLDGTAVLNVGAFDAGGGQFMDGKVSLLRIWNDKRTEAELATNMCNVFGTAEAGMVGEWSLNDVYTDASGNGLTLTSSGSPVFATDVPAACTAIPSTAKSIISDLTLFE